MCENLANDSVPCESTVKMAFVWMVTRSGLFYRLQREDGFNFNMQTYKEKSKPLALML